MNNHKSAKEIIKITDKDIESYAEEDYYYDRGYNTAIKMVTTLLEEYDHD